jgi:hypothetical protein
MREIEELEGCHGAPIRALQGRLPFARGEAGLEAVVRNTLGDTDTTPDYLNRRPPPAAGAMSAPCRPRRNERILTVQHHSRSRPSFDQV